jgi:hypothetical protein
MLYNYDIALFSASRLGIGAFRDALASGFGLSAALMLVTASARPTAGSCQIERRSRAVIGQFRRCFNLWRALRKFHPISEFEFIGVNV